MQTKLPTKQTTAKGITILSYLSITFIVQFLLMTTLFVVIYWLYIPDLLEKQTHLRTSAISKTFAGTVKKSLLVRDYLKVNQEAEQISTLPGVAYVCVLNKRNIVVAGIFSKPSRFDSLFLEMVSKIGFPKELANKNNMEPGETEKNMDFEIGGQPIHDVAISLGDNVGEVHVGLFTIDIQKEVQKLLFPLLISITILFVLSLISFMWLSKNITAPINDLHDLAVKISMGQVKQRIIPKGPREVRNLARSLDRLRVSVETLLKRMAKQKVNPQKKVNR